MAQAIHRDVCATLRPGPTRPREASFVRRRGTEIARLTDPPSITKDRQTGVGLGIVSQEPLRIEFYWVDINTWIVRNFPVRNIRLAREMGSKKRGTLTTMSVLSPLTHQMFAITEDPLGIKYPL